MADVNLQVKDAAGATKYLKETGAGTDLDPNVGHVVVDSGSVAVTGSFAASTIADGADVAQGAIADAAVDGDASGSVNAHLRGISKKLAASVAVTGSFAASTIADGADVAQGAVADAAVDGDASGSVNAHLRGISKKLAASVAVTLATAPVLVAGTANIGDVDVLTLPALPAGTNNIGDVDVLSLPAAMISAIVANSLKVDLVTRLDSTNDSISAVLTAGTAAIGTVKDGGAASYGTNTYTPSTDMSTGAYIGPAPSSGQKSVLHQLSASAAVAMEFTIQSETTPAAERHSWFLPANGSLIFIPRYPIKLETANDKWRGLTSVAGNVRISLVTTSEA